MKIRNIVFVVIFIVASLFVPSQEVSAQMDRGLRKAIEEFEAGHYNTAARMLRSAYNRARGRDQQAEVMFMIGECHRLTGAAVLAENWYQRALDRDYPDPVIHLHLGEAKRMLGKFVEAREHYVMFKERVPNDRRGDDGIRSCDFAIEIMESGGNGYVVENMRVWNTSRNSDFSPVYASDDYNAVYFTSSRDAATGRNINSVTGEKFTDIFVTIRGRNGSWSQPVPIEGDVNTEFDEGMVSFTPDFQTMYFTRCRTSPNRAYGCHIVSAQLVNGRWTRERVVDIGHDTIVIAHPAISPDELTLYFVSDMAGGQGGKDIWKVTRNGVSDNWGRPQNLGPTINTSGDEMFPYVHPDGTLYFSSNGHIGLGGLDIFKAHEEDGGRWTVENMGYPINSTADDFGITFQADTETGYFTSSRSNSNNTTRVVDNIWHFMLPPLNFNLIGLVKDERNDRPLSNAIVTIIGSNGTNITLQTNPDGTFRHVLSANVDYVLVASQQNFLNGRERVTTRGFELSRDFQVTIDLTSIEQPIEIPNIFYDFARWELRPESMVSLDLLVETLNDNPSITIEIGSHTDARGSDEANLQLSQRRAQSVVDYLIEKGIPRARLSARGHGRTTPKIVDDQMAAQHPFLRNGFELTETYINSLSTTDEQEIAHQFNRRTDFRVVRTDYR